LWKIGWFKVWACQEWSARDAISNTEVFCQFTRANETIAKANMQRVTKQSIV
jgi:hypothetical protein